MAGEIKELNIHQKLAKIREQVEVMKKDTKAYGYNYVKEEDILAKITAFMKKYDLSLIPGIVPGTTKVIPYSVKKTKGSGKDIYEENVNEVLVYPDNVALNCVGFCGYHLDLARKLKSRRKDCYPVVYGRTAIRCIAEFWFGAHIFLKIFSS